jgi:hypothetical protein
VDNTMTIGDFEILLHDWRRIQSSREQEIELAIRWLDDAKGYLSARYPGLPVSRVPLFTLLAELAGA